MNKVTAEQLRSHSSGTDRWERELAAQCRAAGYFVEEQIRELIPGRSFVFDLGVKREGDSDDGMLLVEVQGGIHATVWGKGRKRVARPSGHNTAAGISRDAEKLNLAQIHGYVCLHVTPQQIKSGQALQWIEAALEATC